MPSLAGGARFVRGGRPTPSFETLEQLDEPRALLAEARRVLRPGGGIIVSVPNDWTDEIGRDPAPQHLHEYDWEKLRRQLAAHFRIEVAWAQVAGGGMKLTDRPRRLRRVDPDNVSHRSRVVDRPGAESTDRRRVSRGRAFVRRLAGRRVDSVSLVAFASCSTARSCVRARASRGIDH